MTWPALQVQVAFGIDGNDTAAVDAAVDADWTDITRWVQAIPTMERSKRSTELDRFEAGTLKLVLDNVDGRFSPTNASSPYWPDVKPYRMIRVRATPAGGYTYPQWQGYVERWPTRWADPARGLCEVECVDAMATAAQIEMSSVYENEILADAPLYYYPLSDDSGAAQAANQSTTPQQPALVVHNSVVAGDNESFAFGGTLDEKHYVPGFDGAAGLQLTSGNTTPNPGYLLRAPFIDLGWSAWTVEFWVQIDDGAGLGDSILWLQDAGSTTTNVYLRVDPSGTGQLKLDMVPPFSTSGAHSTFSFAATDVTTGFPHHIVLQWVYPNLQMFVDGSVVGFLTGQDSTFTGVRTHLVQFGGYDTVGAGVPNKFVDSFTALDGTLAQVAVYDYALSSTRIAAHYSAAAVARLNEFPGFRAQALFGYADFPLSNAYTGSTRMGPAVDIAGQSLLDCLQHVADTENGNLYCDTIGRLTVTDRLQRLRQTTPAITFGSDVAAGEIPFPLDGLQLDFDPNLVFNDITVERKGGSSPRVYDAPSILSYFERSLSRTSYAISDTDSASAAAWLLDRYRQPQIRSEAITIAAGSLGSDVINPWPQLLNLDISSRVLINHRPMNQPAIPVPGYVDQITHAIDPDAGTWNITLQVSPLFHQYFALADPADHTWDAASTPDADGNVFLAY